MKKIIITLTVLLISMSCITACKSNDYRDDLYQWQSKYEKAEFEKFKEPASVNKLEGTLISVKGKVTHVDSKMTDANESVEALILKDADKKEWVFSCTENNSDFPQTGDEIIAYGEYLGASDVYDHKPSSYITRYINTKDYDTVINLTYMGQYQSIDAEGPPDGVAEIELLSDSSASSYNIYLNSSEWNNYDFDEQGFLAKECAYYCDIKAKNDFLASYSMMGILPNGQNAFYYDGSGNEIKLYVNGVFNDTYKIK